ncbi:MULTISPECIES: hypothetical protein [unclassified Enterobacter cloacae complex]|uniref:hypothetical protein n=1 Tax=unclassified Enterobacter cloacae complex TaxID=2757714 RepID=UPI001876AFEF|nr:MULTISPECIES: hypothetical protein [unclassified Enterobacter cloacae complex]MBE4946308.1 hypothetical protein [Enterobacter cloacae complex sp. P1B]MBE4971475.1 hypothetical protein [Enterobacter cloacae complex sp. P11RS]
MGSMSYCLFRNTADDFSGCLEKIGNAQNINEFSAGEAGAARDLREMAEQYIEWFDQLETESLPDDEEYDEEDGDD